MTPMKRAALGSVSLMAMHRHLGKAGEDQIPRVLIRVGRALGQIKFKPPQARK